VGSDGFCSEKSLEEQLKVRDEVFKLLVDAGGDAYALDNDRQTPLDYAMEWCESDVLKQAAAQAPKLRAELASISSNLQELIVGAAAEMRRLDRARAEQVQRELDERARREEGSVGALRGLRVRGGGGR